MRIFFVGDIVGRPGRRVFDAKMPMLAERHQADLVVANCENAAAGFGVTPDIADELLSKGVGVLTSGNHIWDRKAVLEYLASDLPILRPANYPDPVPGRGVYIGSTEQGARFAILNLQGRTYLPAIDCPFRKADQILSELDPEIKIRFVDFHAEVTSEKMAFGWHLDGRVSAVIGTHTHVTTADERILPRGTAYLTDVGMTGAIDSVIGMDRQASLQRFLEGVPTRFEPAKGEAKLSAVLIEIDEASGQARSINRISAIEE